MASASRGFGAQPPVWSRGRGHGAKSPEAKGILSFRSANEGQICPFLIL